MTYPNLAVEIRGLTKLFGKTKALDGLDLSVAHGEVAGFLRTERRRQVHHNPGTTRPAARRCRHRTAPRRRPWVNAVDLHRLIAYVPGDVTLWPNLTGGQAIDFLTRMLGTEHISIRRRNELIERFELTPPRRRAHIPREIVRRWR